MKKTLVVLAFVVLTMAIFLPKQKSTPPVAVETSAVSTKLQPVRVTGGLPVTISHEQQKR